MAQIFLLPNCMHANAARKQPSFCCELQPIHCRMKSQTKALTPEITYACSQSILVRYEKLMSDSFFFLQTRIVRMYISIGVTGVWHCSVLHQRACNPTCTPRAQHVHHKLIFRQVLRSATSSSLSSSVSHVTTVMPVSHH